MTLADQIKAAYEADQRDQRQPKTAADLPTSYEAINAEWLTAVLCRDVPGAEVTGFELDTPDSGTANRRRIFVRYNDAGDRAALPASVFCKATHGLENRLMLGHSGGIHCEVTFYNHIRNKLDMEAPTSRFAAYDPVSFNSMIILDDMADDVQFCDYDTAINRKNVESQVTLLAAMHGKFFESPELDTTLGSLLNWPDRFANLERFDLRTCCENGFAASEDVIPARLFARSGEIWDRTLRSVALHHHMPRTFNHGDVHLKNWYIRDEGVMGLSDWQVCCKGHWSRDLAYAMTCALTVEDRRNWERDLIALYLDRLAAAGAPTVPFDEAFLYYRQQLMSALAWWTFPLTPSADMPDMQPAEASRTFIHRFATAIDDLDVLDAFD